MGAMYRINRFPFGNLGGILVRTKRDNPMISGTIHVVMPPLKDQELDLHVEGLPNKGKIDTGDHKPVLSCDFVEHRRSKWCLRLAGPDNRGELVWSPLTYANIFEDGRVCWGSGNIVPNTFSNAWSTFWGAPFNKDLAADPVIRERFEDWVKNKQASPEQKARRDRLDRIALRIYQKYCHRPNNLVSSPVGNHHTRVISGMDVRINRLQRQWQRICEIKEHIKETTKAKNQARGLSWVASSDAKYMRAHRVSHTISTRLSALSNEKDSALRMAGDFNQAIHSYSRMVAHRIFYGVIDGRRKNYDFMRSNGLVDMRNHLRPFLPKYSVLHGDWVKTSFVNWLRTRVFSQLSDMILHMEKDQFSEEWDTYVQNKQKELMKGHFCTGEWKRTLVYWSMKKELSLSGDEQIPFPPCEGILSLPKGFGNLPLWYERFVVRDTDGHGFTFHSYGAAFSFFRSITDKVKMLFFPGVSDVYLTNGIRTVPVTDQTMAEEAAKLEQDADIDCLVQHEAMFTPEGAISVLSRNEAFDARAIVKARLAARRKGRSGNRLDALLNCIDADCGCYVCAMGCGCGDCMRETLEDCGCEACNFINENDYTRNPDAHQ